MRVKCVAVELTDEQQAALSVPALFHPRHQVTVGRTYLVLGISFLINSTVFGNCCSYEIQDDAGRCVSMPNVLTEITDGKVSKFWRAKPTGPCSVTLWPEEFYQEFFHDRLSDYEPDAVQAFQALVNRLKAEFGNVGSPETDQPFPKVSS